MALALALLLLQGAVPPAAKAAQLAAGKQWEDLYLQYAAVSADGYSAGDKKSLSAALTKGCLALEESDAVMAFSLGEKAAQLDPTAEALLCIGRTGLKTDQHTAAEEALRRGITRFPKDGRLPLALGKLLLSENDAQGAVAALEKVPKKARERSEADGLKKQAMAQTSEKMSAQAQARTDAQAVEKAQTRADPDAPPEVIKGRKGKVVDAPGMGGPPDLSAMGGSYESSTDGEGRRIRANKHFRFRYFNGQRDFGQRAEYEGRVQASLETARAATVKILGRTRESATDVILYSREEFTMHFGAGMASMVAGFYSESAIRMNDSAEVNARNQATLVHEYTHGIIDELTGFNPRGVPIWANEGLAEYVEWRYEGSDGPPQREAVALRSYAKSGQIPRLKEMADQALVNQDNPALRYAVSACAVRLLIRKKSVEEVLEMIRDLGKGKKLAAVLESRFDITLERLQEQLEDDLKSR